MHRPKMWDEILDRFNDNIDFKDTLSTKVFVADEKFRPVPETMPSPYCKIIYI